MTSDVINFQMTVAEAKKVSVAIFCLLMRGGTSEEHQVLSPVYNRLRDDIDEVGERDD